MKLRTKIITAAAAMSGAAVLGVGAIANTTANVFADGVHTYSCVDITMTETVVNSGAYAPTNAETFSVLHGIPEGELSTTWTNANYKASTDSGPSSAIKIGGSSGKYDGSVTLSFKSYEVSRVIVYAAAWNNDAAPSLTLGDQHYPLPTTANYSYSFQPYTFDFDATSTITLTNGSGNSSSHRIVISKIVFKVTGSIAPIESSTSTETSSEPEDTSTEASWTAATMTAGTNGSACKVNDADGIKVGTSSKGGDMSITVPAGATKLTLYAAAWNKVTGLSLNITGGTASPAQLSLTADSGISNNSPFTLSGNAEDFFFKLTINCKAETTFKFTSSANKRFVVWDARYQ